MTEHVKDGVMMTTDRDRAFPGISELTVTVIQDPDDALDLEGSGTPVIFHKHDIPRYVTCINPACSGGKIDLQKAVIAALSPESRQVTFNCPGHEGLVGDDAACPNRFEVVIDIVSEEQEG